MRKPRPPTIYSAHRYNIRELKIAMLMDMLKGVDSYIFAQGYETISRCLQCN